MVYIVITSIIYIHSLITGVRDSSYAYMVQEVQLMANVNFILDTNSIYGTNSVIKKLDVLIREDMFPRNAWDCPKQTIDDKGQIIIDWKIEGIFGLKLIRFAVDHARNAVLKFFNGHEFKTFNPESNYDGFSWLVRQEMQAFKDFFTSYIKRVESN